MATKKPTSFISEHTAEYFLVPAVVQAFSSGVERVLPLYFWSTREGSTISRQCGPEVNARLIAIYPRRPKVRKPGQDHILVKFNTSLFETARFANSLDIPVFAGVPLASSIFDLSAGTPRAWFYIELEDMPAEDVTIEVSTESGVETQLNHYITQIDEEDLLGVALQYSKSLVWDACLDRMKEIRRYNRQMSWLGGYKPFFIALVEPEPH